MIDWTTFERWINPLCDFLLIDDDDTPIGLVVRIDVETKRCWTWDPGTDIRRVLLSNSMKGEPQPGNFQDIPEDQLVERHWSRGIIKYGEGTDPRALYGFLPPDRFEYYQWGSEELKGFNAMNVPKKEMP